MALSELISAIRDLEQSVEELAKKTDYQQRIINQTVIRSRRILKAVVIALIAIVIVIFCGIALLAMGVRRDDRIDTIQDRTSNEVLCPLYEVFIKSLDAPPPPDQTPQEAENRADADKVIRNGYVTLQC